MAIRYRTRARRLERTISRIEAARRSIAAHKEAHAEQDAWWRRHGATLTSWRREIEIRQQREPSDAPAAAAVAFKRWARSRYWLHPVILRLRLECWWLSLRVTWRRRG
jgi:hypothetical protein